MIRGRSALEKLLGDQGIVFCVFEEWSNEETREIERIPEEGEKRGKFWFSYPSFELPFIQFLYVSQWL